MFRIFNVAVDSELALPELPKIKSPEQMPVYRFGLAAEANVESLEASIDWFHDWVSPDGAVTIQAGRDAVCLWLRFPQLADFSIDLANRQVMAWPVLGTEESTLRHLFLDQVIPRVLGQEGSLILHAGGVQLANGKTVAFVGQTGRGKSTLVSSFERNGARLITDDCMMLMFDGVVARAIPNYAGVRLFDDSIRAVYGAGSEVVNVAQYTSKRRVLLNAGEVGAAPEAMPLDALFLLGDPGEADACEVEIQPTSGAESMMLLIAQSFLVDNTDKDLMASLFLSAGKLLSGNVSCFALNYPRDHGYLDELRSTIERVVA